MEPTTPKLRTHKLRVEAEHKRMGLTPTQIRARKCEMTKARGEAQKAANIARDFADEMKRPQFTESQREAKRLAKIERKEVCRKLKANLSKQLTG